MLRNANTSVISEHPIITVARNYTDPSCIGQLHQSIAKGVSPKTNADALFAVVRAEGSDDGRKLWVVSLLLTIPVEWSSQLLHALLNQLPEALLIALYSPVQQGLLNPQVVIGSLQNKVPGAVGSSQIELAIKVAMADYMQRVSQRQNNTADVLPSVRALPFADDMRGAAKLATKFGLFPQPSDARARPAIAPAKALPGMTRRTPS